MSNIAIEFQNVGKMYRLGLVGTGTLSHDLNRWWTMNVLRKEDPYLKIGQTNDRTTKGDSDYVWALRDISFKVEQGDVVGIIGKNGAGKSTLLKLLSHITAPTTGSIRYNGRIASLLEVGTGFHPEMTGRENIYMNGSIMGMTKAEITRKLDEIVDFAGVERYLDTPVKRYSSGMTVRLGFAVAAFLEPEILVVDEVLTVGDAEFQKRAIGKMNDVAHGEGRTVLFVSHNMAAVRSLCTRSVLLENGTIKSTGNTENIVKQYLTINNTFKGYDLSNLTDFTGNGKLRVGKVTILSDGYENGTVVNNKPVVFEIEILNNDLISGNLEVATGFKSSDGMYLSYCGSKLNNNIIKVPAKKAFTIQCLFDQLPFNAGIYYFNIELMVNKQLSFFRPEIIQVNIVDGDYYGTGITWDAGKVLLSQRWSLQD